MIIQILSNAHSRRVFYRENGEVKVRQFAADATDAEINAAVSTTDSDIAEKPVSTTDSDIAAKPAPAVSSISQSVERTSQVSETSQSSPTSAKSQARPPSKKQTKQTTKGRR